MISTELSRRSFLMGSAAAIAATQIVGTAAMEAIAAPIEVAAPAAKSGSWGYSLDGGEEWIAGFSTREEAIGSALGHSFDDGGTFQTSFCTPEPFNYPEAEDVLDWLEGPRWSLGDHLAERFGGCNEDCDWEGGLSDAIANSNTEQLDQDARSAVSNALLRLGRADAAAAVMTGASVARGEPITEDDDLLEAIRLDATLTADIERAVRAWVDVNGIEDAPRTLYVAEQQDHEVPADYLAA